MKLEEAKNLKQGQIIYSSTLDKEKRPHKWKVVSVEKWKAKPLNINIRLKWGLYIYEKITEEYLDRIFLTENDALKNALLKEGHDEIFIAAVLALRNLKDRNEPIYIEKWVEEIQFYLPAPLSGANISIDTLKAAASYLNIKCDIHQ